MLIPVLMDDFNSGGSSNGSSDGSSGFGRKLPPKPYEGPKKNQRKSSHLTMAADVLQVLLQNSKSQLSDGFLRWRLEQQWTEVVGPTIAEQTLPVAFERGTLHIWVKHPAWMQQLWFFQETIKEKVNNHVGKQWAKQIRFTLSKRAATTDPNLTSE